MKKVLILTTALVATASVAAADVRFSGYGRFGLDYNSENDEGVGGNGVRTTNLTSRLRLQVDMSTETDGGVGFNARFRAQADSRNNRPGRSFTDPSGVTRILSGGAEFNGARFGVTYGGLTVNVGNIIGAVENMPGLYLPTTSAGTGVDGSSFQSVVLNSAGDQFSWDAYSSGGIGANGLEALYAVGGFTGHLSYSQTNVSAPGANDAQTNVGLMLTYTFGDWTVSAARQQSSLDGGTANPEELTAASIYGDIGMFGVGFAVGDNDGTYKYTLRGSVDVGPSGTLLAWVSQEDDTTIAGTDFGGTSYGINYEYDLGGGVTLIAGAANYPSTGGAPTGTDIDDVTRAQTGVRFNF
ncbi:porin [Chachezhania antarctica]|uniref:porin n=1 Tax=Chachezhania antarctica TaxID=2340860 RepID=UPI001F0965AE|nr:porin [Chachezhania antarctica]